MKGLTKTKLVLTVVVSVVLMSAIAIPLTGKIVGVHAQSAVPAQNPIPINPTSISGKFLTNPNNSGVFDATQPVIFKQSFRAINFNPDPSLQNCNPVTGVNEGTRPFTDVYPATSVNGPCKTVVAKNSSGLEQAGVNDLFEFQAAFTANITVPSAGTMTSSVISDDGFIFSVGPNKSRQPTAGAGNPMVNAPPASPFKSYNVIAANNQPAAPVAFTVVTNFPAAGTYPMELDYTECCGGSLVLVMSNSFAPQNIPWGVDSTAHITKSLYDSVKTTYGTPDFWARYIGSSSSYPNDMSVSEAAFAHSHSFAILPIYFNYAPNAVKGYATGQAYATAAIKDAQQRLKISQGVALFIDIEAASGVNPDAQFVQGWYDRFNSTFTYTYNKIKYTYQASYYKAGYYGDGKSTSRFAIAYCSAVSAESQIGTNSFIWSSAPTLKNRTSKTSAPFFAPDAPSCANQTQAWQYALQGSGGPPAVNTDEVLVNFPLWHP